ncbi:hypothetical protein RHMOL_Rhmol06G0200500 [Rhododendron molle]|uniref:Uncharacterized protein n=1 Tax=Rhododendron molle TaxID=49168 RepID=A0ACC0NF41_RHOML|nr:hypothetical protein RHMOL_Rhmol06G0200500 [Rhododendron molle]
MAEASSIRDASPSSSLIVTINGFISEVTSMDTDTVYAFSITEITIQVWEAALQAVKDEEAFKQKLCKYLNNLVQESSNTEFARLEELKRPIEILNPSRSSTSLPYGSTFLKRKIGLNGGLNMWGPNEVASS